MSTNHLRLICLRCCFEPQGKKVARPQSPERRIIAQKSPRYRPRYAMGRLNAASRWDIHLPAAYAGLGSAVLGYQTRDRQKLCRAIRIANIQRRGNRLSVDLVRTPIRKAIPGDLALCSIEMGHFCRATAALSFLNQRSG